MNTLVQKSLLSVLVLIILASVSGCGWHSPFHGSYHGPGAAYHDDYSTQPKYDRAMEILRARYAKGEITQEEFEKMKADLQK